MSCGSCPKLRRLNQVLTNIVPEFLSMVMILIMMLHSSKKQEMFAPRSRWFNICLSCSFLNILLDILSIYITDYPDYTPLWVMYLINALFFASAAVVMVVLTFYLIILIYKQSQQKIIRHISRVIILIPTTIFFLLSLLSPITHSIFYFDDNKIYHQGPLIYLAFVSLIVCAVVSIIGTIIEKKNLDNNIIILTVAISVIINALLIIQYNYPILILSGTCIAYTNFLLFISFQNKSINVDHLTGLGNREAFYNSLICFANTHIDFKVVFVGLRSFKNINDKYGQRAGDSFIIKVANFLGSLRKNGLLYRFNGVEFVFLLPQISDNDFMVLLSRITERFSHHWKIGYMQCMLNVSIVDISYPEDVNNSNDLMTMVEGALRMAKSNKSKNVPVHLSQRIRNEIFRRNELVDLIKQATVCRNFSLCYQPVYDCNENRFVSAESLIRMHDGNGQPISPGEFIPIAEEIGSVVNIGWYVLEEVCHFLSTHRDININSISINLSQQQFMEPQLVNRITETLEKYDVEPSKLKLELTERVIEKDTEHIKIIMNLLQQKGIGCYMDDFGTGYSNLFHVINLPFECVKLDRSLIGDINNNITSDIGQRFLIESLIRSFQFIGAKVIAEGVEQESLVNTIRQIGVDMIQSFYFSKPLNEQNFLEFLSEAK